MLTNVLCVHMQYSLFYNTIGNVYVTILSSTTERKKENEFLLRPMC